MNDDNWFAQTIAPKSDQLNADDLLTGPLVVTVTGWKRGSDATQPIDITVKECKPYRPCKSMRRVLAALWGTDPDAWIGRQLKLYCDPKVKFGGQSVGGIRISHMTDIPEKGADMQLTETRGKRTPFRVELLKTSAPRTQPKPVQSEAQRLREALIVAEPDKSKRVAQFAEWGVVDPRKDDEFTPEKLEMMWQWIEENNGSKFA